LKIIRDIIIIILGTLALLTFMSMGGCTQYERTWPDGSHLKTNTAFAGVDADEVYHDNAISIYSKIKLTPEQIRVIADFLRNKYEIEATNAD